VVPEAGGSGRFYEAVPSVSELSGAHCTRFVKGLPYESVVHELARKTHMTPEYGRINPLHAVPVGWSTTARR